MLCCWPMPDRAEEQTGRAVLPAGSEHILWVLSVQLSMHTVLPFPPDAVVRSWLLVGSARVPCSANFSHYMSGFRLLSPRTELMAEPFCLCCFVRFGY